MRKNILIKVLLVAVVLVILVKIASEVFIEPWVAKKIQTSLNEKNSDYIAEVGEVNILLLRTGIGVEGISLKSKKESENKPDLILKIAGLEVNGIKIFKALFKKDIKINEVRISGISILGMMPFSEVSKNPVLSPYNIHVKSLLFNKTNLNLKDYSGSQSYLITEGNLQLNNILIGAQDTLSIRIFEELDFEAEVVEMVTADSMYSLISNGITYSSVSKSLLVDSFKIHPNYSYDGFNARIKYQTDRLDGVFQSIYLHELMLADYIKTGNLACSFIEIGKMDMDVFRDKRKEFEHTIKPPFQEKLYSFPGTVHIDSLGIATGNVTYTEHASEASEPGRLSFHKLNAKIYNIFNDTIYKTESKFLELEANALLMGTGKLNIDLKSRLYESQNTFSLKGNLVDFEISKLNPFLEKNAFIYATSGELEEMNFNYIADNSKAMGDLLLVYKGLDITLKNKESNDTTAFKERLISVIANRRIIDSNPKPGEEIRVGIIDYKRDPERFVFGYVAKSVMTGVKSSIEK